MVRSLPLLLLALAACGARGEVEPDRAELLRLHTLARTAHLEKRADLLVASFADSFLNISYGTVAHRTPSENRARFQAYFYAWVELYEKRAGKWTLMAVVSTDRPGPD